MYDIVFKLPGIIFVILLIFSFLSILTKTKKNTLIFFFFLFAALSELFLYLTFNRLDNLQEYFKLFLTVSNIFWLTFGIFLSSFFDSYKIQTAIFSLFAIFGIIPIWLSKPIIKGAFPPDFIESDLYLLLWDTLKLIFLTYLFFIIERLTHASLPTKTRFFLILISVKVLFEILWVSVYMIFSEGMDSLAMYSFVVIDILIFPPLFFLIVRGALGEVGIWISPYIAVRSIGVLLLAVYFVAMAYFRSKSDIFPIVKAFFVSIGFISALLFFTFIILSRGIRDRITTWIYVNIFRTKYDWRLIFGKLPFCMAQTEEASAKNFSIFLREVLNSKFVEVIIKGCDNVFRAYPSGKFSIALEVLLNFFSYERIFSASANGLESWVLCGKKFNNLSYDAEDTFLVNIIFPLFVEHIKSLSKEKQIVELDAVDKFSKLSSFVLHDLKNVLYNLKFLLETKELGEKEEIVSSSLSRVNRVMKKLTLPEKKGLEVVDIFSLTEDVITDLSTLISSKGVLIKNNTKKIQIVTDRDAVFRIVLNLLKNAVEAYTNSIDKVVTICSEELNDEIKMEFKDSAGGLPEYVIRKGVFSPFVTTKPEGLGLGLYEVKTLVEELGGNISFETSKLGTTFSVIIPKKQSIPKK